jgi:hypothetical protein
VIDETLSAAKDDVDWELHTKGMNLESADDDQTLPRLERRRTDEAAAALL